MSFSEFELECLDEHNKLRALHGCAALELDHGICNYAKQWAEYLAARNSFQHRTNNRYGENLYMASGMTVDGRVAVRNWYAEIRHYRTPTFSYNTGHFTQLVWKSSRKLGVAMAQRGNTVVVVANYDPPGNVMGRFLQNLPLIRAQLAAVEQLF